MAHCLSRISRILNAQSHKEDYYTAINSSALFRFVSPFRSGDGRRVDLELVRPAHECRRRLEGADVRPVAELRLCVAPDYLGAKTAESIL